MTTNHSSPDNKSEKINSPTSDVKTVSDYANILSSDNRVSLNYSNNNMTNFGDNIVEVKPRVCIIAPEDADLLTPDSQHANSDNLSLNSNEPSIDDAEILEMRQKLEREIAMQQLNGNTNYGQPNGNAICGNYSFATDVSRELCNFLSVPGVENARSRTVSIRSVSDAGSTCVESPDAFDDDEPGGTVTLNTDRFKSDFLLWLPPKQNAAIS